MKVVCCVALGFLWIAQGCLAQENWGRLGLSFDPFAKGARQPPPPLKLGFSGLAVDSVQITHLRREDDNRLVADFATISIGGQEYLVNPRTEIVRSGVKVGIDSIGVGDSAAGTYQKYSVGKSLLWLQLAPPPAPMTKEAAAKRKSQLDAAVLRYHQQLADSGDPRGQFEMGIHYLHGLGVTNDSAKARDYLTKSAAQGYAQARTELDKLSAQSGPARTNSTETIQKLSKE